MLSRTNNKGFALISVVVFLAVMPLIVLISTQLTTLVSATWRTIKGNQTMNSMTLIRGYMCANSADIDNDSWHELYKEAAGNALPISIPLNPNDQWGTPYKYCTWDLGVANGNATYSQNNIAPPKAQMIGKLISAGPDKTSQTACSDTVAKGDDLVVEVYESDARGSTGTLGGWQKINNFVSLLTSTDLVGVGTGTPTTKLHLVTGASGGILVDAGNSNNAANPGLTVTSSGAGWGSGISCKNTTPITGRNYGLYAGSDGVWHFTDTTSGIDRLQVTQTGLSIPAPDGTAGHNINVTGSYQGPVANAVEICNDIITNKALVIAGNASGGGGKKIILNTNALTDQVIVNGGITLFGGTLGTSTGSGGFTYAN